MKTVIFVGPSLPQEHVKDILPDALVLDPAEQGDIDFARYQLGADIIGLLDGRHTQVLPPLHKEILSVLADGCRVIGAASMGALRAVECEDFGAEPVGEVARMYKEGEIEDDSEVCLVHGDRDSGFKHLSVSLVDIRATLKAADIDEDTKLEILDYAKALYYPDRDWQTIFNACDIDNRTEMIIQGSLCDIKEADSLHLCHYISQHREKPKAKRPIRNAHYGFAAVFEENDRKILSGRKVIRKHQIANATSRYDRMNARNRALALELCRMLGLAEESRLLDVAYPDLTKDEAVELYCEELSIQKAADWLAGRDSAAGIVKSMNDFLRISGRYEEIKERI